MHPRELVPALTLCVASAAGVHAQARVQLAIVPEFSSVAPGVAFRIAVRLRIPDGCHISWINPGQSGLPTTIAWRAPVGVSAAETQWPYPERDETAGLVSHVYRGVVVVVTPFIVDSSVRGSAVKLQANLSWGLCGATCTPQQDTVEVSLPIQRSVGETTAAWQAIAPSLGALPVTDTSLTARAVARGDSVRITIAGSPLSALTGSTATFFPRPSGVAVVVAVGHANRGITITLPVRPRRAPPSHVAGVLVADRAWLVGSHRRALAIEADIR